MNPMPELIPMLKQLRLSGMMDSLESRNRQAIEQKLSCMDSLCTTIIQDEIARRTQRRLETALRRANFRNQKTLEEFDFTFNPNINRALIMELASCRFIEEKVCVFIVGPCGTSNYRKFLFMERF
ncbi:MAG: ATP-binding protein [Deltaproteobacteria bacterium]|nr:ATP-binding protein [Deltaproteobacteria bacterium]